MSRRAIALSIGALLLATAARAQDAAPPRRYALLIGLNKAGANIEGVSELRFAQKDAEALEEILNGEQERKFETIPLIGPLARRETIVDALARLAREAKPQDTVLIYFSGHGVRAKWAENAKRYHTYWVTYDTTLARIEIEGLRLEHIMDYVDDIPALKKIVILDHCHSGTVELPRTDSSGGAAGDGGRSTTGTGSLAVKKDLFLPEEFRDHIEKRVAKEGLLVIVSAADPTAYELQSLGHGLFTYALLQALKSNVADASPNGNGDGWLSAEELVKYLKEVVPDLAQRNNVTQEPIYLPRGDILGWDLFRVDDDREQLLHLLGTLAARGSLEGRVEQICNLAVTAWSAALRNDTPVTERDRRIVERLRAIQAKGPGTDWTSEAQKLVGFVDAL